MPPKKITKAMLREGREEYPEAASLRRPSKRSECVDGPRPCPWVGCPQHLYLDVHERTGSIKFNHPDFEPTDMLATCALDIAAEGEHTLDEVGALMNVTRERVRQVEDMFLAQLKAEHPNLEADAIDTSIQPWQWRPTTDADPWF